MKLFNKMSTLLLKIAKLRVSVDNKVILNDINLNIKENETHVIMGPNGSGKSTLSKVLAGHPMYLVNSGNITFHNKDLNNMTPEERSHNGLFLAFQYPIEIPGITNYEFLRIAYNEKIKFLNKKELSPMEFLAFIEPFIKILEIKEGFLQRSINDGLSGGEKKINEVLQVLVLKPNLIIMDEIDSGLDADSTNLIASQIKKYLPPRSSIILITHYTRLLDKLKPDYVHILDKGTIIKTGGTNLAKSIEKFGYKNL
jgi:Fe-S cluster assembly ATP-binding protein